MGSHPFYGPQPTVVFRNSKVIARSGRDFQRVAGLQAEFVQYRFRQSHS